MRFQALIPTFSSSFQCLPEDGGVRINRETAELVGLLLGNEVEQISRVNVCERLFVFVP